MILEVWETKLFLDEKFMTKVCWFKWDHLLMMSIKNRILWPLPPICHIMLAQKMFLYRVYNLWHINLFWCLKSKIKHLYEVDLRHFVWNSIPFSSSGQEPKHRQTSCAISLPSKILEHVVDLELELKTRLHPKFKLTPSSVTF